MSTCIWWKTQSKYDCISTILYYTSPVGSNSITKIRIQQSFLHIFRMWEPDKQTLGCIIDLIVTHMRPDASGERQDWNGVHHSIHMYLYVVQHSNFIAEESITEDCRELVETCQLICKQSHLETNQKEFKVNFLHV